MMERALQNWIVTEIWVVTLHLQTMNLELLTKWAGKRMSPKDGYDYEGFSGQLWPVDGLGGVCSSGMWGLCYRAQFEAGDFENLGSLPCQARGRILILFPAG